MNPTELEQPMERRAVPVTVLTAFLGAGKTTLLNRILNGDHGLRVAVLVNDFGSINIDADLMVGVQSDVISLANGCVCCSIRDDLIEAIEQVMERPEHHEYILLEASGVADPVGIAITFIDARFRDRIRLDSITCVMDAEQVFNSPEQMRLKLWQIATADMLILNKVDLMDRDQIERIKVWLDEHFHRYWIIEAKQCDVPLEILLSAGRFDTSQLDFDTNYHDERICNDPQCQQHHNDHTLTFSTWCYETNQLLSIEVLLEVTSRLPANIYRCKGVIFTADTPDKRAVLQVIGKRVDITLAEEWGKCPLCTKIVAIGAHGTVDEKALSEKFDYCIAGSTKNP